VPQEERAASWHLVEPDGRVKSAGAALPPLLRLLPGGRPLAAVFDRFPRATARGYRWVADHRSVLGRGVSERARRRADGRIAQRS
jgi:predicted DCC family thiol-disulfide oxidoreductase YuxK